MTSDIKQQDFDEAKIVTIAFPKYNTSDINLYDK